MERLRFSKAGKLAYHGDLKNGLRAIFYPMGSEVKEAVISLYIGVGGYNRTYTIGGTNMPSGTPGMLLEALKYKHSKKADPLFTDKDVHLETRVEESYMTIEAYLPKEKALGYIDALLSLGDEFNLTNEEVEKLKPDYLKKIKEEDEKVFNRIRSDLYFSSPMKGNPYGNEKDLKAIHFSTLKKFLSFAFSKANLSLIVIGDLVPEKVEEAASKHVIPDFDEKKQPVEVKPFKENYARVVQSYGKSRKKGEMVVAIKMPPRKDIYTKFKEEMFTCYELVGEVLFGKAGKKNASIRSHILSLGEGGFRQGGEDAFYYQVIETGNPQEVESGIKALLSDPKIFSYFEFKALKKEYFENIRLNVYNKDVKAYMHRASEALANDFLDEALTEGALSQKKDTMQSFLNNLAGFAKVFIE